MVHHDRVFWDFQFFGQKTTQSGIRFSFRRRAAHFDLNRVAVLADYLSILAFGTMWNRRLAIN